MKEGKKRGRGQDKDCLGEESDLSQNALVDKKTLCSTRQGRMMRNQDTVLGASEGFPLYFAQWNGWFQWCML